MTKVGAAEVPPAPRVVPYRDQRYDQLKTSLLMQKELFQDPEFPADASTLVTGAQGLEWKRPNELVSSAMLVVDGVSCDDLQEGDLGNTWFVSACSALARNDKLWNKVIPDLAEQELSSASSYAGIVHVRFWRSGEWVDVVIDDRLPCRQGQLVFCHSSSKSEFWSALLEKAYAKLYGGYEALRCGFSADALVDFTGGVAERLDLSKLDLTDAKAREKLFQDLRTAIEKNAIVVCNITSSPCDVGTETGTGLVRGHGYLVRELLGLQTPSPELKERMGMERLQLIRLINPWGTKEWTGAWSDNSKEWTALTDEDRRNIGINFDAEGDFWMSVEDFVANFTNVDICHLVNAEMLGMRQTWHESVMHGAWTRHTIDEPQNSSSLLLNPQYMFDADNVTNECLLSLEQKDGVVGDKEHEKLKIGFHVMQVEKNRKYRVHCPPSEMITTTGHMASRSVCERLTLKRGRYVLIPSTEAPGQTGTFMLRAYALAPISIKELIDHCPDNPRGCCAKPYCMMSRVEVVEARDIGQGAKTQPSPFAVVTCEGESVKSAWCSRTGEPVWNFSTLFYHQSMSANATVEIFHHRRSGSLSLGIANVCIEKGQQSQTFNLCLTSNSSKDKGAKKPGKVTIKLTTSTDLMAL